MMSLPSDTPESMPVALSVLESRKEERVQKLQASRKSAQVANNLKIREAFVAMEAERVPVTVSGISERASVARQTVYNSPYIKEIQTAAQRTAVKNRSSMKAQSSEASLKRRLSDALEDIQRLRRENDRLKKDLHAVVAQLRAPQTR